MSSVKGRVERLEAQVCPKETEEWRIRAHSINTTLEELEEVEALQKLEDDRTAARHH